MRSVSPVDHRAEHGNGLLGDPAAEAALLACLLRRPADHRLVTADDFTDPRHRAIFAALVALETRGEPVDIMSMNDELRQARADVSASFLADLATDEDAVTPGPAARILRACAARRWLDSVLRCAQRDLRDPSIDPADTAAAVQEHLASAMVARPAAPWVRVAEVEAERVTWLWPGRVPLGKLILLDGDPGLGKSTLALDLAARVSAGLPMPFAAADTAAPPAGVVVLSAEDGIADTIRPRLEAAGADIGRVLAFRSEALPTLADLGPIERAIGEVAAVLVVVDPLMAFLGDRVDAHQDHDVRRTLAPLAGLAERTRAAVLVVRHLNKMGGGPALYRGGGSIGIVGAARSALLVARDPEDELRRVLAPVKHNLCAPPPALAFTLVPAGATVRVEWLGESTHTADALVGQPEGAERGAVGEAREALAVVLAVGPVPAEDVERERTRLGISSWAWRGARRALRVRVEKAGFHDGWTWTLPRPSSSSSSAGSGATPAEKPAPLVEDDGRREDDGREDSSPSSSGRPSSSVIGGGFSAVPHPEGPEDDEDDGRGNGRGAALPAETLLAVALLTPTERARLLAEYEAGDPTAAFIAEAVVEFGAGTRIVACPVCGGTRWRAVEGGEVCVACDPVGGGRA